MTIKLGGTSASLKSIELSCTCGKPTVTMEGAFGQHALRDITRCHGRRPWLRGPNEDCPELPRTLQRGASNVWFAVPRSALSIPPWSEGPLRVLNRYWTVLQHVGKDHLGSVITGMRLAEATPYSVSDLVDAVGRRKAQEAMQAEPTKQSLKVEEYEALTRGKGDVSRDQDFVCVPVERDRFVSDWFERVMAVKRLREVRALESFTRLLPPSPTDPVERRGRLFDEPTDWLPAIEVTGEGVFFQLSTARLVEWEANKSVVSRADRINRNYALKFLGQHANPTRIVTPRLLLIHTLAHAIINQWAFDSGYPAASLRERLYVADAMAGFLVYTATSDSAGSLGGVVGRTQPGRLGPAIREAIERASWCSADPLCIEADAAGVDSLNLAACHACVLLPEVSCEEMNVFLDRGMLIGPPTDQAVGFFAALIGAVDRG